MMRAALPLFDGFIQTPFECRFQGLLRQAWHRRSWHVIVAEKGERQDDGDLRSQRRGQPAGRDNRRTEIPRAGSDSSQK